MWYAFALLAAPVSVTVSLLLLSRLSLVFLPGYLSDADATLPGQSSSWTLALAIGAGVLTGILEETGWTGFVIPRLLRNYSVGRTGILVGVLWGTWHLISNLVGSTQNSHGMLLPLYMVGLLYTFLPPFRILMVWLYAHTRSLLLLMSMHASLVTAWLASTPRGLTGLGLIEWYVAWGPLLWVAVGAVLFLTPIDRRSPSGPALEA